MNIFVLSTNPREAAQMLCNKHVGKMLVESAQIICSAMFLLGTKKEDLLYKPTHVKHPCVLWTAAAPENMKWVHEHALELCKEHTKRYGTVHRTENIVNSIVIDDIFDWRLHNPFVLAMPEVHKTDDAVQSYRNYYIVEKARFAKWLPRAAEPDWWPAK